MMASPPFPPFHLIPGCGHLFFPPDVPPPSAAAAFAGFSFRELAVTDHPGAAPQHSHHQLGLLDVTSTPMVATNPHHQHHPLMTMRHLGAVPPIEHQSSLHAALQHLHHHHQHLLGHEEAAAAAAATTSSFNPLIASAAPLSFASLSTAEADQPSPPDPLSSPSGGHPHQPRTMVVARRQRGEKKPIPAERKDEKYFERRKRNNEAAKKSRDARKMREDRTYLRARILEHQNELLRAQLLAVRAESRALRMIFEKSQRHQQLHQQQQQQLELQQQQHRQQQQEQQSPTIPNR